MEKVFVNTDHRPQLVSQLSSLWRCKKYCDAVIHQGSSSFELHKIVLFASCPDALKQLMHTEDNNVFDFYLTDEFEDLSVNAFLTYLYDGAIQLNQDNVEGLERIAKKLKLFPLLQFCKEFWNILEGQADFQRQILLVYDQRDTALQSSFKPVARENLHMPDSTTNIVTLSETTHEERVQASSTIVTPSKGTSSLKRTLDLTDIPIKIEPDEMEDDVLYLGLGSSKADLTGSLCKSSRFLDLTKISASRAEAAPNQVCKTNPSGQPVNVGCKTNPSGQPVNVGDIQDDISGTGIDRDIFGIEGLGTASWDDLSEINDTMHLNAFDTPYRTVKRRRTNNHYSPEIRAEIGKYALEHGNTKAAKKYSKELNMSVGESTVRSFKKQYLEILKNSKGEITELMKASRGQRQVLGDLNQDVADQIYRIREAGGVISQDIVIETVQRVAKQHNNLDSIHIAKPNKSWATSFLKGLGFVNIGEKSSEVKTVPFQEFESHKQNFVSLVKAVAKENRVPRELTINFHQVCLNMIPVSHWTLASSNTSQIPDNDRFDGAYKFSLLIATSASGTFLPPQVIYDNQAKQECSIDYPSNWDVLNTKDHQPTEESMIRYINKILVPYTKKIKTNLEFPDTNRAMVIFHINPQICSEKVLVTLKTARIDHVFVPNNFLAELQPVTLSVVAPIQAGLKESFMNWYSNKVAVQLLHPVQRCDSQGNKTGMSIDLSIQTLKPLHAEWLVTVIQSLENVKDLILSGWSISGALDVLE